MIIPRNPMMDGYIMEFKAINKRIEETVPGSADAALKQIEDKI
jgi:hypothetical protein